jgi:hypothetical protein
LLIGDTIVVTRRQIFSLAAALGLVATAAVTSDPARADSAAQAVVDHSLVTVQDLRQNAA